MVSKAFTPISFSDERKELLALLLAEEGFLSSSADCIQPDQWQGNPPLSFAQERLWFLYQMEPNSALYNIPMAIHCVGTLYVTALEKSLTEIMRRHQVLRATFHNVNGRPVQSFRPIQPLKLPITSLQPLDPAQRQIEVDRLVDEAARRPFDLEQGPLLRAGLLCLGEQEHILLLTVHHIVADGLSYTIFMEELQALYAAYSQGRPSPLPELPFQFADFAHWQRQWLENKVQDEQMAYWRKQLAGAPAVLELPTDRPRPPRQTYAGGRCSLTISPKLTGALKTLSRRQGISLYVTLLTTFNVLLYRYTGQQDIVLGSPVANRNQPAVEKLMGLFINTLALRTDLSNNPTFEKLLGRVSETVLEAYDYQELPFEKLVEALQVERHMNRTPLFQVVFNFQNSLIMNMALPGLTMSLLEQPAGLAKFDLTVDIRETNDQLTVAVEYNTDLFEADTVGRLLGHYQTLLEAVVDNPEQPIGRLPLLTPAEREQLLLTWNNSHIPYPREASVHDLFEQQVEATPDAIALLSAAGSLTYQQLNSQANQLAHYLQAQGVGPEVFVTVFLERSPLTIIALLAILKAGGLYVPLEPGYPAERLAFMLQDTQSPILLTTSPLRERLPAYRARVICLDDDWAEIGRQSQTNPASAATADNLAYVMYTSGSTGRPKGAAISHRSIVRLVKETNFASLTAEETFLQFAPLSFDASTLEIWGPLLNGGRLAIMPPQASGLAELAQAIKSYQVTALWLTAGLFHQMVEDHLEALAPVRQLLAGGDVLSVRHVKKLLAAGTVQTLINGYGPTENTTFTCCYPMQHPDQVGHSVAIGRPIANSQVYLLDRNLELVPVGIPGELYTGGDGLARGYLNQPGATAEKFIPNPFSSRPGGRLYKTGDLARYRPDGSIEFLGRNDDQVKVRGFRVELAEVELALSQHPDIENATVIARADASDSKQLVAYLVLQAQAAPSLGAMRRFLQQRLPDYMVPSSFIVLDKLPLSANGKVDRRLLPQPDQARPDLGHRFVAPRDETEEKLAEIWTELLRREQIGIHDNFFELGGHSLLATRIMSHVEAAFGISLPLHLFFETPTVGDMAEAIRRQQANGASRSTITPIQGGSEEMPLSRLDDLSDEEVDSLLEAMLNEAV